MPLKKNPLIYEINTKVWLNELSKKHSKQISLSTIPAQELNQLVEYGIDAVWLMGVWKRSLKGAEIARTHPVLKHEYTDILGSWRDEDIGASPYAILDYEVDPLLGGESGLAALREHFKKHQIKLILDFIPNHFAIDTPFLDTNPSAFLQNESGNQHLDQSYFQHKNNTGNYSFAHGKDPYFPSWTDTVQIDYSKQAARSFMTTLLEKAAAYCDGLRCDMAQLIIPKVFEKTWGKKFDRPETFWKSAIQKVKSIRPDFTFIAEVYWALEWELQQEGFDFTYDKILYDRLRYSTPDDVRGHLWAELSYQEKLLRFIENHDEDRAITAFADKAKVAALLCATVPGATLLHQGQLIGRSKKIPVQLARLPEELPNPDIKSFYHVLLKELKEDIYHLGEWNIIQSFSAGDDTWHNIVSYQWTMGDQTRIIALNLNKQESSAYIRPRLTLNHGKTILFIDRLNDQRYEYETWRLNKDGLYIKLAPYTAHLFDVK
ncbi:MAG: alpha-amylase family glycosyl hydrolase [Pseudomonadota bacterium]